MGGLNPMSQQFHRDIESELLSLVKEYPVVTITGPRQSGKTTLVKKVFPNKTYINMTLRENQVLAEEDPTAFFSQFQDGCIIDEVQLAPGILAYVQNIVDNADRQGMFILTGSNQLALSNAISQSLAGRTALLSLLPLSIRELMQANIDLTLDEYLLKGFMPRIYDKSQDPTKSYRNYLQTYLERDVRELINLTSQTNFNRFLKLCAGRIGQLINYDSLATDVGVSSNTIKDWLSVLEASYIIFRLQPYHNNFGKRLIKTPKIYFTEVGLATYLLGITSVQQLERDPLRGSLIENLVILELLKTQYNQGKDPNLYFYRDQQQREVDIIAQVGEELIPIEIKSAMTITSHMLTNIKYFSQLAFEKVQNSYLIYTGETEQRVGHLRVLNFKNAYSILSEE